MMVIGSGLTRGYVNIGAVVRAVSSASKDQLASSDHLNGRPFSVNRYRGSARSENSSTKEE